MKGLDKQAIIKTYKNNKKLYTLRNQSEVIGQEIDDDNRLVYVVRQKNGEIKLSFAEDEQVVPVIIPTAGKTEKKRVALVKQPEEEIQGDTENTSK